MGLHRSAATSGRLQSVFLLALAKAVAAIDKATLTPRAQAAVQAAAAALPGQAKRTSASTAPGTTGTTRERPRATCTFDLQGFGETRPIPANEKDDGSLYPAERARNRHVEIAVLS